MIKIISAIGWVFALILLVAGPVQAESDSGHDGSPNIALRTLSVTLFERSRARGLLFIDVNLALHSPEDRDDVVKTMPRLRDRYLQIVSQLATTTYQVDKPVNLPFLTAALQRATDQMLGENRALVQIGGASTRRL